MRLSGTGQQAGLYSSLPTCTTLPDTGRVSSLFSHLQKRGRAGNSGKLSGQVGATGAAPGGS